MRFSIRISIALLVGVATALTPVARSGAQTTETNVSASFGPSSSPAAVYDATGTLHVAWADAPGTSDPGIQHVYYARSTNGGASFEPPRRVSSGVADETRASEVRVLAGGGGQVAVAWWGEARSGNITLATAFVASSADGGASFSETIATGLTFRIGGFSAKEGFAFEPALSVALDPGGVLHLLATVQDYRFGFNVYYANVDLGEGVVGEKVRVTSYSNPIPRAARAAIALLPDGRIHAVWTESQGDFIDEIKDVFSATSRNGGRSFSAPRKATGAKGVVAAALPLGGDALGLLVQLQNKPRAKVKVNFLRSTNGGETYGAKAPVGIATADAYISQNGVAMRGDLVGVAWIENSQRRGPAKGIYIGVSRDGGRSFSPPILAVEGLLPEPPALVAAPDGSLGLVYVSPEATLAERDVFYKRIAP